MEKNNRVFVGKLVGFTSVGLIFIFTAFYTVCFIHAIRFQLSHINQSGEGVLWEINEADLIRNLPSLILMFLFIATTLGFCIYFTVKLIKSSELSLKLALIIPCFPLLSMFIFELIPAQSYFISMYTLIRNLAFRADDIGVMLFIILKMCQVLSLVFVIFSCMLLAQKEADGKQAKIQKLLFRKVSQKKQIIFLLVIPFCVLILTGVIAFFVPVLPNFNVLEPVRFIGYSNYLRLLLKDGTFLTALINTYIYPVVSVLIAGFVLIAGKNIRIKNASLLNGLIYYPLCYFVLNIVFGHIMSASAGMYQMLGTPMANYSLHTIVSNPSSFNLTYYPMFSVVVPVFLWLQYTITSIVLAVMWIAETFLFHKPEENKILKTGESA